MTLKIPPILVFLSVFCTAGFAQEKQAQPFKPPVVRTSLGKSGSISATTPDQAKALISLPLIVTDNSNTSYAIESYQFLYKKKSVIEDQKTGRKATTFSQVADLFKTTPLPQSWVNNISGNLQKDEELSFFDIVVKDEKGRKFFAPDLRIKIQ